MPQFWSNTYNYEVLTQNFPSSIRENFYVFIGSTGRIKTNDLINNNSITSILDYGCGYSNSIQFSCNNFNITNVEISKYDPFIPAYSTHPNTSFDLVVCHNVLEYVEGSFLNEVVQDIADLSNKLTLFNMIVPSTNNALITSYTNAIQAANLNIIDSKVSTAEDKITAFGNILNDNDKTNIRAANKINLTVLANKV